MQLCQHGLLTNDASVFVRAAFRFKCLTCPILTKAGPRRVSIILSRSACNKIQDLVRAWAAAQAAYSTYQDTSVVHAEVLL